MFLIVLSNQSFYLVLIKQFPKTLQMWQHCTCLCSLIEVIYKRERIIPHIVEVKFGWIIVTSVVIGVHLAPRVGVRWTA